MIAYYSSPIPFSPLTVPLIQDTYKQGPAPPNDYLPRRVYCVRYTIVGYSTACTQETHSKLGVPEVDSITNIGVRSHYLRSSEARSADLP